MYMKNNEKQTRVTKSEVMLNTKTNQDFNNQKPTEADPNQTENHQAEKPAEIEYEPKEEKVRKGAKGNGLYIGDEDKRENGLEYYYSSRSCSARTKDLRREHDAGVKASEAAGKSSQEAIKTDLHSTRTIKSVRKKLNE